MKYPKTLSASRRREIEKRIAQLEFRIDAARTMRIELRMLRHGLKVAK